MKVSDSLSEQFRDYWLRRIIPLFLQFSMKTGSGSFPFKGRPHTQKESVALRPVFGLYIVISAPYRCAPPQALEREGESAAAGSSFMPIGSTGGCPDPVR